jgi:putative membrane protein
MMYWGSHMSAGGWIFSIFGTLIILGLIVAAIAWLIGDRGGQAVSGGVQAASGESAREVLDRRLASGELDLEQYNQLRAALVDGQATTPDARPPRPASMPG